MDTLSKQRQITEGVIWKQLLIFFFPILLGTFFQQMYNTVDTIIVGRLVGTEALAAVGATGPLVNMVNGFFIGVSSGATVILSQFYGAEDRQQGCLTPCIPALPCRCCWARCSRCWAWAWAVRCWV